MVRTPNVARHAVERGNVLSERPHREKAEETSQSTDLLQQLLEEPLPRSRAEESSEPAVEEEHAERS
jgi:hypothetical protein